MATHSKRKNIRAPHRLAPAVAMALALAAFPAAAQETSNLDTLDGLVGQWLALRTTIAEENRSWQARKAQWESEIQLLATEQLTLEKEIAENADFASSAEKEQAEILKRRDAMEAELEQLEQTIGRAETNLKQWKLRIPPGLNPTLSESFRALENAEQQSLTTRAQNVITLYSQIELLQQSFHATREMLDTGKGARRQVDILYIGLARGFAVSPNTDWAAIGLPTDQGWKWIARPELAPKIRRALEIFNHEETAELVTLPMKAEKEAAQ